jgi:hypothetical protein
MAPMRRFLVLLLVCAAPATAAAAVNPEQLALQKSLKAEMAKTFKKQAPALTITTVTCKLPSSGTTSHCTAHFTAGGVKGYYPVTATLHDLGGTLSWTAASPKCFDAKTGKGISCSG